MAKTGQKYSCPWTPGDREAISQFVGTYSDSLVRFAYGYVKNAAAAEDVAGDAIALLFVKGKHFESEEKMRAYLYKTARSKAIDYLRRNKTQVPLEDVENVLYTEGAEEAFLRKQRNEQVYLCMQKLPEDYRVALYLSYFDGFSLGVAGRIMGKTEKQMYNIHARAKIALRKLLEKEGVTCEDL